MMVSFNTQDVIAQCPFTINGPNYACNSTNIYTITGNNLGNPNNYTWTLLDRSGNNLYQNSVGLSATFVFPILYSQAYQIIVNFNNGAGQTCQTVFLVYSCCDVVNYRFLSNTSINQEILLNNIGINSNNEVTGNYLVLGTLTIGLPNVIFKNCNFLMAEGSSIDIGNNEVVTFDKSNLQSCNRMWKGINILNNGKIKTQFTTISGALYGINFVGSSTNHNITSATVFKRNYVSIYSAPSINPKVISFSGISGFEISGLDPMPLPFLGMVPANPTLPLAGVFINNVTSFPIDNSTSRPIIHDLPNGILSVNSGLTVENCDFYNINRTGIGIRGTAAPVNIRSFGYRIRGNKFGNVGSDIGGIGVSLFNCYGSSTNKILISSNTFNEGNTMYSSGTTNRAIQFNNPINTLPVNVSIVNNSIAESDIGINCSNIISANLGDYNASILSNIISFDQAESTFNSRNRMGINIASCTGLTVSKNKVIRNLALLSPSNVNAPQLRLIGINVNTNARGLIFNDTLSNLGTCIRFIGVNTGTQLFCNRLVSSFRGVHLNTSSFISAQGTFNRPQDNQWVSFGNVHRISFTGIYAGPLWFLRTNSSTNFLLNPIQNNAATSTPGDNYSFVCGTNPGDPLPPDYIVDDPLIDQTTAAVLDSLTNLNTTLQISASQLYELLRNNNAILDSFPELSAFYNAMNEKFEGQYIQYLNLLEEGNYASAFSILDEMNPDGELQIDLYATLNIARNFIGSEDYVLTANDTMVLLEIANKSVYRSGNAVINARAMLGLVMEDILNNFRIGSSVANNEIKYSLIGDTYFFFDGNDNPVQSIEVFNPIGQLLYASKTCRYIRGSFPINSIIRVNSINSNKSFRGL
jgi:hypothetical protein